MKDIAYWLATGVLASTGIFVFVWVFVNVMRHERIWVRAVGAVAFAVLLGWALSK